MNEHFIELGVAALYLAMVISTYKGLTWSMYKFFGATKDGMPMPMPVRWALMLMSICFPAMLMSILSMIWRDFV